jgi:S1-C subfamily serine protease
MPALPRLCALLLGNSLLFGCAAHATTAPEPVAPHASAEPEPPVPIEAAPPTAQSSLSRADASGEYLGVIDRAGLTAIVTKGLGHMLARLQLSPELDGKQFRGFRVASLDPQWSASGVQTGDVITRLNGQPIERPEQAMVAFDSLRVASEVAVDIVRDGKPLRLRYRIE